MATEVEKVRRQCDADKQRALEAARDAVQMSARQQAEEVRSPLERNPRTVLYSAVSPIPPGPRLDDCPGAARCGAARNHPTPGPESDAGSASRHHNPPPTLARLTLSPRPASRTTFRPGCRCVHHSALRLIFGPFRRDKSKATAPIWRRHARASMTWHRLSPCSRRPSPRVLSALPSAADPRVRRRRAASSRPQASCCSCCRPAVLTYLLTHLIMYLLTYILT